MSGQCAVTVGEIRSDRKINRIESHLRAVVPCVEVVKDKAYRRLNPSYFADRRITLQHTHVGPRSNIKSERGTNLAHPIQIEGQRKKRKQDIIPCDREIVNHGSVGHLKPVRPLYLPVSADNVIGHRFAAHRARQIAKAMQITCQRVDFGVCRHGILKISSVMAVTDRCQRVRRHRKGVTALL